MITRTIIASIFVYLLLQISGCHFYVDSMPRIIVSSEQFQLPSYTSNNHPNPAIPAPEPNSDR